MSASTQLWRVTLSVCSFKNKSDRFCSACFSMSLPICAVELQVFKTAVTVSKNDLLDWGWSKRVLRRALGLDVFTSFSKFRDARCSLSCKSCWRVLYYVSNPRFLFPHMNQFRIAWRLCKHDSSIGSGSILNIYLSGVRETLWLNSRTCLRSLW